MQALDMIEPGFRPMYEAVCSTNKGEGAEHIFFEGQLLDKGLGKYKERSPIDWGHHTNRDT
jgi:hypothetical protein